MFVKLLTHRRQRFFPQAFIHAVDERTDEGLHHDAPRFFFRKSAAHEIVHRAFIDLARAGGMIAGYIIFRAQKKGQGYIFVAGSSWMA